MAKRIVLAIGVLLLLFGGIFGYKFWPMISAMASGRGFGGFQPPPVAVSVATAQQKSWEPVLTAVATLVPVNGVDLATEVAGVVSEIRFKSGVQAEAGALLVQLDDSADRAELQGLEAELDLARRNFSRAESLIERNLASRETLDTARTELQRAEAAVANKRALIAKKAIRAPFSGTLGIRNVNVGQYVSPGTQLVSLQNLDTLYAAFSLPQQEIRHLRIGQAVRVGFDGIAERVFEGRVTAIDSKVDEATHTIRAQATLANAGGLLRPGMYGVVSVALPPLPSVVTVPKSAISYSLYGNSVYVVRDEQGEDGSVKSKAVRQVVKLGEERDDEVIVVEGVAAGDRVVTAGHLKLQDGALVKIDNGVALGAAH